MLCKTFETIPHNFKLIKRHAAIERWIWHTDLNKSMTPEDKRSTTATAAN